MNVAIFTDFFHPELGGIQDSVVLLARTLGERGHYVQIYAPKASKKGYRIAHLPERELDLGANVRIIRLFSFAFPSPTFQSRVVVPSPFVPSTLKHFKPDIVHTNSFFGVGLSAIVAARRLKVPLVGTNHFAVTEYHQKRLLGKIFAWAALRWVIWYFNRCDFVTGPSHSVIEELASHGIKRPSRALSNLIDTSTFNPVSQEVKAGLKQKYKFSEATIVYAGKFSPEKEVDILVRAFAVVRKKVPGATLALAGHGGERPHLEAIAQELGISDGVKFLGTLTPVELAEAFQASNVFSSASTSETQSLVLFQAMSCGIPAVAVAWRAFIEYVPASVGFLAKPRDPNDLGEKLITLLEDAELCTKLGRGAREYAEGFSRMNMVKKWEELFASLAHK